MAEVFGNLNNPNVLVIGVFHGDEPQGNYLIREYVKQNPKTNLLMLPCLNKSGYDKGNRLNANGVDLNRNFPTKNWEKTDKNEFYGGDKPASESETKFLIDLINNYSPKIILTLHAPFKVVNYDGGEDAKKVAEDISKLIDYPVECDIGYPTPGSFGTWAGVERGISTITLELDEEVDVKTLEEPVFKIFKMLEEKYGKDKRVS